MTARKPLKRPLSLGSEEEGEEEVEEVEEQENDDLEEVKSKRPCFYPNTVPVSSLCEPSPLSSLCEPAPLSSELPPPPRRLVPLTYEEAKRGTVEPVRVYADGIYDLFHNGHARSIMQAKNLFPNTHLIIGTCNDEITHKLKGKTVCKEAERYDAIRHCRYVDELLIDAPWVITTEFLEEHQIDFVAHDDLPYNTGGTEDIYKTIKEMGRFVPIQRTPGVSTSELIARVVKDYDIYLQRNLAKGYTAKELNVGFIKEKRVKLKEKMSHLKNGWEEKRKDFIDGFITLFGRDGRISEFFHGKKEMIKRVFSPGAGVHQNYLLQNDEDEDDDDDSRGETTPISSHTPSPPPSEELNIDTPSELSQ